MLPELLQAAQLAAAAFYYLPSSSRPLLLAWYNGATVPKLYIENKTALLHLTDVQWHLSLS